MESDLLSPGTGKWGCRAFVLSVSRQLSSLLLFLHTTYTMIYRPPPALLVTESGVDEDKKKEQDDNDKESTPWVWGIQNMMFG